MLEKADKHYKELVNHRNELDQLLIALTSGPVVSQVGEECEEEGERERMYIYTCVDVVGRDGAKYFSKYLS